MTNARQLRVASALVAIAAIGFQVFFPLTFPDLGKRFGLILLGICGVGLLVALVLLVTSTRRVAQVPRRQWSAAGFGQGWLEVRVRNNAGSEMTVSCNPGSGADQIAVRIAFQGRRPAKRSETVELLVEVDSEVFEWDVPDTGSANFELEGTTWRGVESIRQMIAKMRSGRHLNLQIPDLKLQAKFTLEGAFDALRDAEELGQRR